MRLNRHSIALCCFGSVLAGQQVAAVDTVTAWQQSLQGSRDTQQLIATGADAARHRRGLLHARTLNRYGPAAGEEAPVEENPYAEGTATEGGEMLEPGDTGLGSDATVPVASMLDAGEAPTSTAVGRTAAETGALRCIPSSLEGYDCVETYLDGNVMLHYAAYQAGDGAAQIALETPSEDGWVAMAFSETGTMVGSTAVIATTSAANGAIGVFELGGYSVAEVTEIPGAVADPMQAGVVTITDATVERSGGVTIARFSRPYDDTFTGTTDIPALVAYHSTSSDLAYHTRSEAGVMLSLSSKGEAGGEEDTTATSPAGAADDNAAASSTATAAAGSDVACTPSQLEGLDCVDSLLSGNVLFHYKTFTAGDDAAQMALETPSDSGWVGIGFSSGGMIGSTAVIATTTAANGNIGVFTLGGYSAGSIVETAGAVAGSGRRRLAQDGAVTITDATVERVGGSTIARFSRPFDDSFTGDAGIPAIVAYHSSSSTLDERHNGREEGLTLSLTGGAVGTTTDNTPNQRRWHAALMIIGWGVLLPVGIVMASTMKWLGPIWFQLHRGFQVAGLLVATAGFVIALVQFDSLPSNDSHRICGIVVMSIAFAQPLNALVRPHPPKEGEKTTWKRRSWEVVHKFFGYGAFGLSVSTIFQGIRHAKTYTGLSENHSKWLAAYIAILVTLCVAWIGLAVLQYVQCKRHSKKGAVPSKNDATEEGGPHFSVPDGTDMQHGSP